MFMFPLKNLACKGLDVDVDLDDIKSRENLS